MKKNIIYFIICLTTLNIYGQDKKETVYVLFDLKSQKKCIIEDGSGHNFKINMYRKENKKGKVIFNICDEKFNFNPKEQKADTCTLESLKKLNIKNLDYIKNKYQKGQDFKHHTFKQINIVEIISDTKIVKYFDVYWCCEWIIE